MELTPWKLPHGTYTIVVTSWQLDRGKCVVQLTPWKLHSGTYTMEVTSWN